MIVFYDSSGRILSTTSAASPSVAPPPNPGTPLYLDDTEYADVWANPGRYLIVNGAPVLQPHFSLTASENGGTWTLTATLNNPPSPVPAAFAFTVAGQTADVAPTADTATYDFTIDASLAGAQIIAAVAAAGCVSSQAVVTAGAPPIIGLQVYTPTSGTPTLAPVGVGSKAYLRAWAMGLTPEAQVAVLTEALQDLYVATSAVMHLFTSKIVPALTAATYAPITLTAAEEAALTHWQANLQPQLLPLAGLLDAQGNPIAPYAEAIANAPTYQAALTAYSTALGEIPGLE